MDHKTGWNYANKPAKPFSIPKRGMLSSWFEFLRPPSQIPNILITAEALVKMYTVVSLIELEVGWLGTAYREGKNVLIKDVFLFNQDVSYGHTELTSESMSDMMNEVLANPGGEDIFNNFRFWGHSHGNGSTHPSEQDNSTMHKFGRFGADFFVRGIFNRTGDINFSLYDWEAGYVTHRLPWKIVGSFPPPTEHAKIYDQIRREMASKVIYNRRITSQTDIKTPKYVVSSGMHERKFFMSSGDFGPKIEIEND